MNKKILSASLALAATGGANAATLGDMVIIPTAEGFVAELPIIDEGFQGEEFAFASTPGAKDYAALGLKKGDFADSLVFSIEKDANGRRFVQILSDQKPKKLSDILVELKWDGGMALKEISVAPNDKNLEALVLQSLPVDATPNQKPNNVKNKAENKAPPVSENNSVNVELTDAIKPNDSSKVQSSEVQQANKVEETINAPLVTEQTVDGFIPSPYSDEEIETFKNKAREQSSNQNIQVVSKRSKVQKVRVENKTQTSSPEKQSTSDVEKAPAISGDVYKVQKGDSLLALIKKRYPVSLRAQAFAATIKSNPETFRNGNAHLMAIGDKIAFPSEDLVKSVSKQEADENLLHQSRLFVHGKDDIARSIKKEPKEKVEQVEKTRESSGVIEDKPVIEKKEPKVELKSADSAQENKVAKDKELAEAKSRADALKKNIEKLESIKESDDPFKLPDVDSSKANESVKTTQADTGTSIDKPKVEDPFVAALNNDQKKSEDEKTSPSQEPKVEDQKASGVKKTPEKATKKAVVVSVTPQKTGEDMLTDWLLSTNGLLLAGGTVVSLLIGGMLLSKRGRVTQTLLDEEIVHSGETGDFDPSHMPAFMDTSIPGFETIRSADAEPAQTEEVSKPDQSISSDEMGMSDMENIGPSTEDGVQLGAELDGLFSVKTAFDELMGVQNQSETHDTMDFNMSSKISPKQSSVKEDKNPDALDLDLAFDFADSSKTQSLTNEAQAVSEPVIPELSLPGFEDVPQWSSSSSELSNEEASKELWEQQPAVSLDANSNNGEILDLYDEMAKAFESMGDMENAKAIREEAVIAKKAMMQES